jgi:hypothetical protein
MKPRQLIALLSALIFIAGGCAKKGDGKWANMNITKGYKPEKNVIAIVMGKKHVFTVMTPDGWVLDKRVAEDNKLGSFFYPENSTTPTYIYIYVCPRLG